MQVSEKLDFYMHCKMCLEEVPEDLSPAEYQSVEVGVVKDTLIVQCKRHNLLVFKTQLDQEVGQCSCCGSK